MTSNQQAAQQARRYREHQWTSQLAQPNIRWIGQQARRDNEGIFGLLQLLSAHQPWLDQTAGRPSLCHQLSPCDILCRFCGAEHWIEERVAESTLTAPKFSTCCMGGTIMMDKFNDPPLPLYSLLTESSSGKLSLILLA